MTQETSKIVVDTASGHRRCPGLHGGLGAKQPASKKNQRPAGVGFLGTLISESMLASPNDPSVSKNPKSLKNNKTHYPKCLNTCFLTSLILSCLLINIGCATSSQTRKKSSHVLDKQVELIQSLKRERKSKKIAIKVHADSDLSNAEVRLLRALDAIVQSNETLKDSLKLKEGK